MIFVSTGTQFPFDRLMEMVDGVVTELSEEVVAQALPGKYTPRHFRQLNLIPAKEYDEYVKKSRLIVAHAGMGIIITAMRLNKPILVLPRLARLGEHRNDHQVSTATHLEELGYLTIIKDEDDLRHYLNDDSEVKRHLLSDAVQPEISSFIADEISQAAAKKINRHKR